MRNNSRGINALHVLACLIVARFSCSALSNIPLFSMTFTFLYGCLFAILFLMQYGTFSRREFCGLMGLACYVVYVVITTYGDGLFNTQAFNSYVLVFLYFVYLYMKRIKPQKAVTLGILSIVGYAFTYLYSIPLLLQDPDLSRKTAASLVTADSPDKLQAIGGFDTVYGTLLVIAFLIYFRRGLLTKKSRFFATSCLVIGMVFLVMASYGTAVVMLIILLAMVMYKKNKIWSAVILLSAVTIYAFRVQIGYGIMELANSFQLMDTLGNKINDVAYMMITGESTGTLAGDEGRFARMGWSFATFLRYPILGGYGKPDAVIGYHSEVFDTLARFGIVGTSALIVFLVSFFKDLYHYNTQRKGKLCLSIMITIYGAVAILDPALYTQQVLPFFCIAPLIELMYRKDNSYEKNAIISSLQ